MGKYRLRVTFDEVRGDCHVHKEGDEFIIERDGQTIRLEGTEKLCLYALTSISSILPALTKELPEDDWMSKKERIFQCLDPGPERGGSGKAYMKIKREKI